MRSLTIMTISRSPPRPRPPLLKNRRIETAMATHVPAKLSVPSTARSRHPLPALYRVPGQLTEPSRRQSSCFLQCSPSPCTLPGHSLGHIRVHEPPCQQKVTTLDPPFCGTQLAEICGVKGRGTSSFRGPTSLSSAAGPPQEPPEDKRPPGAEGPPEGKKLLQRSSSDVGGPASYKVVAGFY